QWDGAGPSHRSRWRPRTHGQHAVLRSGPLCLRCDEMTPAATSSGHRTSPLSRTARHVFRHAPRPMREWVSARRELARLVDPLTFSEKVRYKILADRRPLLTTFADKYAVREYVKKRVGAAVLTELYAVTTDPGALRRDALPREFVVKGTHGSGATLLITD